MHSAKCKLYCKRSDFANSQDFDMKLKTKPTGKIQISSQKNPEFSRFEIDLENFRANNRFIG